MLDFEVLTPTGWSSFSQIKKTTVHSIVKISFVDLSILECTENHLLKMDDGKFAQAEWMEPGISLNGKIIKSVEFINKEIEVYDLVNVEKNNEYYTNGVISHNCEFMGSSGTLLSAAGLKSLAFVKPVHLSESGIKIYQEPISNHNYMLIADTSRGKGLDYSAYLVIDTTVIPYRVVSTYKDNNISPLVYPSIIKRICEYYNQAYALIEINDNGQQVADSLFEDYDYENILSTVEIKGKIAVTWGYGNKSYRGIRTTKSVKRLGCSIMKNLIESQKVIIQDFDLIAELSTFIAKGTSFEAEEGSHDDLVMCLVLFSWMTNQQFFSELTNTDVKTRMHQEQMKQIEEEQLPTFLAGHLDIDEAQKSFVENGVFWNIVER